MSLSWGAVSGAFLAPFLYGLFWRRTTGLGAMAGMVSGIVTSVALFFLLPKSLAAFAACLGMAVPFAIVPIVSLFTPRVPETIVEKAFARPAA